MDPRSTFTDAIEESRANMIWGTAQDLESAIDILSNPDSGVNMLVIEPDSEKYKADPQTWAKFNKALSEAKHLKGLEFLGFDMSSSFRSVLISLMQQQSLNFLALRGCGIKDSCSDLMEKFLVAAPIQVLCLEDNEVSDGVATAVGKAMGQSACRLRVLDLRKNYISDEGCRRIAEGVKVSTAINFLNLEENYLGDIGAEALVECLDAENSLIALGIYKNKQISRDSVDEIALKAISKGSIVILPGGLPSLSFYEWLKLQTPGNFPSWALRWIKDFRGTSSSVVTSFICSGMSPYLCE